MKKSNWILNLTDFQYAQSRLHCLYLHIEKMKNIVSVTYARKLLIPNHVCSCPLLSGYHYTKSCWEDGKNKLGLFLSWGALLETITHFFNPLAIWDILEAVAQPNKWEEHCLHILLPSLLSPLLLPPCFCTSFH